MADSPGEVTESPLRTLVLIAVGLPIFLLGAFIAVVAGVNLPDSWIGALLAAALLVIGAAVLYQARQSSKSRVPYSPTSKDKDAF
jgi:putative effector of murein hydrolase LrgA (UPF0299 family)